MLKVHWRILEYLFHLNWILLTISPCTSEPSVLSLISPITIKLISNKREHLSPTALRFTSAGPGPEHSPGAAGHNVTKPNICLSKFIFFTGTTK